MKGHRLLLALPLALLLGGCPEKDAGQGQATPPQADQVLTVPRPDTRGMEPQVRRRIAEVQREVEAKPDSARAWGRLGKVCDVHELDTVALEAYAKARELAPREPRWPYLHSRLLAVQGLDLDGAVAGFQRALELDPSHVPSQLRLGDVQARQGKLQEAEASYRRVLEMGPEMAVAWRGLGQVLLRQETLDEALQALEKARDLSPDDATVLFALAQVQRRLGRTDEAARTAEEAALRQPVDTFDDPFLQEVSAEGISSTLLMERAVEYLRLGNYREALTDLLVAEEARSEDPYLHRDLAKAYQGLDDFPMAIQHFERSLELKGDLLETRVLLGLTLVDAQRIPEARTHLERARREAPEDPQVAAGVAVALTRAGQTEAALREFQRAASLGAISATAHNEWGSLLAQRGRLREALEHFRWALAEEPRNPQILFNLGLASEALGDREQALDYYRRTMEIEPNPMAASRIQQLGG